MNEEQPFALRGGGDSRIDKRTKKKKLTKTETSRMNEQKLETMLANAGLSPQDQPDLEDLSSGSDTSNNSISAIGKSDSEKMLVNSSNREDQGKIMDSGEGEILMVDSDNNKDS